MGCGSSTPADAQAQPIVLRTYTMEEVAAKNEPNEEMLIVIEGNVYRPFKFIDQHPGGGEILEKAAGRDVTKEFDINPRHSDNARKMLKKYMVGTLEGAQQGGPDAHEKEMAEACEDGTPIALKGLDNPIEVELVAKKQLSPNTFDFTFALPSPDHVLGLPIGQHVRLLADVHDRNGKVEPDVGRSYTPTSVADQKGTFNLVIKVYYKNQHPKFPEGGKMTQHMDQLKIGGRIRVAGPKGKFEYTGLGSYTSDYGEIKGRCSKMGFVCGGSGITPAFQVIQAILRDPKDSTSLWLLFANQTEGDILLREEIDALAQQYPERFRRWYVVSQSVPDGWQYSAGRVTQDLLQEHLPQPGEDTLVAACGPPGMLEGVVQPALTALGHTDERVVIF